MVENTLNLYNLQGFYTFLCALDGNRLILLSCVEVWSGIASTCTAVIDDIFGFNAQKIGFAVFPLLYWSDMFDFAGHCDLGPGCEK